MKDKLNFQKTFLFLLLVLLNPVSPAFAEIYKWVDESGKVHFGDKPKDSATAQTSEKVELKQDYVPGAGLSPEQVEAQKAYLRRKDVEREQQKQDAEKSALKRKELQAQCKSMRDRLKGFINKGMMGGKRKRVDYFVEDGKPVSSKRQQEIAAEMQRKINKKCS